MKVLHAFWLPDTTDAFFQGGSFRLWVERPEEGTRGHDRELPPAHPFSLSGEAWPEFLDALGVPPNPRQSDLPEPCTIHLPSAAGVPLPSPQSVAYQPEAGAEEVRITLEPWRVDCLCLSQPIRQLGELHFLVRHRAEDVQPGDDFLFWYWFTQELKGLLLRDQYLPTLIHYQPSRPTGKRK